MNDRKFPWNSKLNDITLGLINKKYECTQRSWLKWAKPYTSRVVRRKQKQELKKSGDNDECYKEFNDQFRQIAEMLEEIVYPEKEKESKKAETK